MVFKEISQEELIQNRKNAFDKNQETLNLVNKVNEILYFTKNIHVKSLFRKLNKIKYDRRSKIC
jgi:hypothetical protein